MQTSLVTFLIIKKKEIYPTLKKKKIRRRVAWFCLDFIGHCGGQKIKIEGFFIYLNTHFQFIFDSKHLENTLGILINTFMI